MICLGMREAGQAVAPDFSALPAVLLFVVGEGGLG